MLQGWESQTRKLITGKGTWKQAVRPSGRCRRRHRGSPLATRGTADLPDLPFVWVLSGLDKADGCGQHRARRHLCSHRHLKTHVRHGPVQKAREETAGRPGALRGPRPGSTRGLAERRGGQHVERQQGRGQTPGRDYDVLQSDTPQPRCKKQRTFLLWMQFTRKAQRADKHGAGSGRREGEARPAPAPR